jgi:hypothetical protein
VCWSPFVHGTSSIFLKSILRDGLKPRVTSGEPERTSVWEGRVGGGLTGKLTSLVSRPDRVYFTPLQTLAYAIQASTNADYKFGGTAILIVFNLDESDSNNLVSDEDAEFFIHRYEDSNNVRIALGEFNRFNFRTGSQEFFPRSFQDFAEQQAKIEKWTEQEMAIVGGDLPEWVGSLLTRRTAAYRGVITPNKLVGWINTHKIWREGIMVSPHKQWEANIIANLRRDVPTDEEFKRGLS